MRLTVEQTPSGPTIHRVVGRLADESEKLLAEAAETTVSGGELDVPFADPFDDGSHSRRNRRQSLVGRLV